MKRIIVLLLMLSCACLPAAKKEEKAPDLEKKIWVSIYQGNHEYWGSVTPDTLEYLNDNKLRSGFIRVEHVHWVNPKNNRLIDIRNSTVGGEQKTYTGVIFMSVESIKNIVILNAKYVAVEMNKEFRKKQKQREKNIRKSEDISLVRKLISK